MPECATMLHPEQKMRFCGCVLGRVDRWRQHVLRIWRFGMVWHGLAWFGCGVPSIATTCNCRLLIGAQDPQDLQFLFGESLWWSRALVSACAYLIYLCLYMHHTDIFVVT